MSGKRSLFRLWPGPLFALAALAALLGPLPAQPPTGRKIALLVGVKAYNHSDLPDLAFSERDVEGLAQLLEPAGYRVILLTTSAADAGRKPTLANINRELAAALKDVTKHDTILVALSGHGVQPEGGNESCFCPSDGNPKRPATLLPLTGKQGLVEQLADSGVGVKLLLVDACRNNPAEKGGKGIDGSRMEALPKGVAALFSCSAGQQSFETDKAGGGHGVFFHFVLEGLRGKARKGLTGEVTWARLAEYVQENVEARVPEWVGPGARQVPNEVKNLSGRSPVLVRLDAGPAPADEGKAEGPGRPTQGVRPAPAVTPFDEQKAKEYQQLWAGYLGTKVVEKNSIGMDLVLIPPGKFVMGSPIAEQALARKTNKEAGYKSPDDLYADEEQHPVEITRPFYLGVYEVTQAEYEKVMGSGIVPSHFSRGGKGKDKVEGMDTSRFPVEKVSWQDAVEFCARLSERDAERRAGRKYRLPTEAEWEYACRAGTRPTAPFSFGRSISSEQANFDGHHPYGGADKGTYLGRPAPVGSYRPNAFGLYDMYGNVWEWCADCYDKDYYRKSPKQDPRNDKAAQERRVMRGGSWWSHGHYCRTASRLSGAPDGRAADIGFRVVLATPAIDLP
jgi:formylglycine-generating enzyme required for sulfatase activity